MQAQAMAAQVQLKTIQESWISQHGVTVWEQLSIFRHDGLHSAEVIHLLSTLLLRNTIRWVYTRGCKMCNSLTAFKTMGWTPPASPLAPCSHFFWQPLFWTMNTLGARSGINQSHIKKKLWIWNRQNVPDFDVFGALSLESILQKSLNGFSW